MTIQERIEADYKAAFKAHREAEVSSLRLVKSAFTNAEIALRKQLDDAGTVPILQQVVKRHREAMEQFLRGGREDLAAREREQLAVVERYLPAQATDDEIRATVKTIIGALPARTPQAMGQVMGQAMAQLKGKTDGNRVRAIVEKEWQTGAPPTS